MSPVREPVRYVRSLSNPAGRRWELLEESQRFFIVWSLDKTRQTAGFLALQKAYFKRCDG